VVPHVHPKDADTIIVTDVVSHKSTDGGKTFVPFKGAPGGDDNQNLWWNPNDPNIMLLVVDQGAVITLNGGQTWSSWFTQPTAALYHVMTDNAFPYRVCGGQQDSGSVCIASRGKRRPDHVSRLASGRGSRSTATPAPDPLDADIVYGGKVTPLRPAYGGRSPNVGPVEGGRGGGRGRGGPPARPTYRTVRTQPVVFSTVDKRAALFYGKQRALENAGRRQSTGSRSVRTLTRETWEVPKNVGTYASSVRGAVSAARFRRRSSTRSGRPIRTSTASGSAPTMA